MSSARLKRPARFVLVVEKLGHLGRRVGSQGVDVGAKPELERGEREDPELSLQGVETTSLQQLDDLPPLEEAPFRGPL